MQNAQGLSQGSLLVFVRSTDRRHGIWLHLVLATARRRWLMRWLTVQTAPEEETHRRIRQRQGQGDRQIK